MKKILAILITCLLCIATVTGRAQQVGLTIAPQGGPVYTAGNSFQVFANYNYSNVTGNIQVVINYDPSVLSFCGSPSFPATASVVNISATSTTISYSFPALAGNNQTGVIMMCFSYVCPQLCSGTNISSAIGGNITAPAHSLTAAASPVTVNGVVNNNWSGLHNFYSFIQSSYEVTFRLYVSGSTCFRINNPYFEVNPSIGTLVSATNATVSGNTITPVNAFFTPGGGYLFYYTVKIPCNTPVGTVVSSTAVLKGFNCGNSNATILNLPVASYTLPAVVASNTHATFSAIAASGYYQLTVYNAGNTPLNLTIDNTLPQVKTNSVHFLSSTQTTGITANVTYRNCSGIASVPHPLATPGAINTTPPSFATKADIGVSNLLPGHNATFRINYDLSNSCSGVPNQQQYTLLSSMTYACNTSGLSEVCYACGTGGGTINDTAVYEVKPNIRCWSQQAPSGCFEPGDTVNICLRFENNGEDTLRNGVLQYNLPSFLGFIPGSETFSGFSSNPVYQPATNVKWSLPLIPDATGYYYNICFKAVVGANAPYGVHNTNYSIAGTGYNVNLNCGYPISICALPGATVEKKVKGNLDAVFSTSGNGHPGSTAHYEITVRNTGNTPIGNIILIDRMPFPGDATIMSCTPRNSQFTMFPAAALTIPGATVTYSNTGNIATGWPTAPVSCAVPGSFSAGFQPNSLKITLANPIPAGGNYTFSFPVTVPAGAVPGQTACNSIGLICDLIDNAGNSSQMNPVESNLVCLTVQQREEPPVPCTPCKEMVQRISLTGGNLQSSDSVRLQNGSLHLTVGKALQEVRISVADINYSWENKGCADCGMPVMTRGCLYPAQSTQMIGGLVWDNYSNVTLPPNAPANQCMEELIWKMGSQAPAGSYNIPLQLSLPVATVNSCCRLRINSICLRVTLKDKDCNTCDTIICIRQNTPYTPEDCCKESRWIGNTITSGSVTGTGPVLPSKDVAAAREQRIIVPAVNVIQAKCNETHNLIVNTSYTFFAGFQCAAGACPPRVEIQITGPGVSVSQTVSGSGYTTSFSQAGTYQVIYKAYCGNKLCAECRYRLVVKKKVIGTPQPWPSSDVKDTRNGK